MRRAGALDDLAESHPGRLHEVVLAVGDRANVIRAVDTAIRTAGRLDVVVNNAGYGFVGAIEEVAEDEARAIIDTNLTIAELDGFDTDWATSSMQFATPLAAYDGMRLSVLGTSEVPWPQSDEAEERADAPPTVATKAIIAHVDADDGPLRLLVGDNSPTYVAMALDERRRDYIRDERFTWPADSPS